MVRKTDGRSLSVTILNTRIKIVLAALAVMAAIIAVTAAALCGSKPFSIGQTVDLGSESVPGSKEQNNSEVRASGVKRYLLIGEDENHLTDTMIVAFCYFDRGEVRLLSIPRDTYVGEEIKTGKLNAVYSHAKYPYPQVYDIRNLAWYIKTQLGVELDGYIKLTFAGFRKAVDEIGGIPIYLPKTLYDPHTQSAVLEAGQHVLDGNTAELFVRFRSGYFQGDETCQRAACVAIHHPDDRRSDDGGRERPDGGPVGGARPVSARDPPGKCR